jgi:hypothetical protein
MHARSYLGSQRVAWDLQNEAGVAISAAPIKRRELQPAESIPIPAKVFTGQGGAETIIISGNHDSRIAGNRFWRFGESYRYVAELGVQPLHEDPQLKCLFFCFNSSKAGNFARGEILEEDLVRLATEYHVRAGRNPEIKNWLRVALVHHHPFQFDATAEGWTAKFLKTLKIPEGQLVDMNESERFVRWCEIAASSSSCTGTGMYNARSAKSCRFRKTVVL